MKKIISFIMIFLLSISGIFQASANDILNDKKVAIKNILVTKSNLKKISNGEKYILAMDNFVEKNKSQPEKISTTKSKIDTAVYNLQSKQLLNSKERQLLTILSYLQARLKFIELDNFQKMVEADENKYKEILETAKNPNISDTDKQDIEAAIVSIQKNLLEHSQQNIEKLLGDFENYYNYELKGDFEMNFKSDHEEVGNINAEMKLSDYITQSSNFDSRFNGHISAMIDALPKGEEAIKTQVSSFIDFISKDGQIYALVKDLNITNEEDLDNFQDIVDTLKKLSKENKYIEISDEETQEVMKIIQSFNPDALFNDAHELFSKPMFTAYKKENDVFYIIPTKYACDSLKVLTNKFDPFSPNSCSDSQYNTLIEDILTQGELTMTLGNENVIKYSQYPDKSIDTFDITVSFTDNFITKINITVLPNQEKYKNEKLTLDYEKNKQLNMIFYADNGDVNVNLESTLDSRNNFSNIKHNGYIKRWKDEYIWNLDVSNRKIDGTFKLQSPKTEYNYETGKYEELGNETLEINLDGTTNTRNEVSSIHINFLGNDLESDYLTGEFLYNIPKLKFTSKYQDKYGNADINFEGKWNTRNSNFDSFDTQIEITQKERTFDYETYSYQYSGEEEKVFDLDYSLNNSQIEGTLHAYDNNEVIFGVISNGTYKKDQLKLNNEFKIDFINNLVVHTDAAKDSKRSSDLRSLASAIEVYSIRNGKLPEAETFWIELGVNKDDFVDPDGNIEKNNCKYGYTYSKSNRYYQLSTCLSNTSKNKHSVGNYYEGAIETLGEPVYLQGYTTWIKQEVKEETTPIVNINFDYDHTSNKNNFQLFMDMIYKNEKLFELNMKNTGTKEYKKVDIIAPNNTVPMEEVIETDSYYYY